MKATKILLSILSLFPLAASFTFVPPKSLSLSSPRQTIEHQTFGPRKPESFSLAAATGEENEGININALPAAVWISLVAYATFVAPGSLLDTSVTQDLIEKIVANPTHPEGINELFYTVFNLFTPMPLILAALILPQANESDRPTPFLVATTFLGYFTMGPYLATRGEIRQSVHKSELGFFTRNLFENSLFGKLLVLLTLAAIAGGNAFEAVQLQGWEPLYQDFVNLLSTTKFCNVSVVDLAILHVVITLLIPSDYALRRSDDKQKGLAIAAATFFLPYVGSSLYIATRPSLPDKTA